MTNARADRGTGKRLPARDLESTAIALFDGQQGSPAEGLDYNGERGSPVALQAGIWISTGRKQGPT